MKKLFTFLLLMSMIAVANAADISAAQAGNWSDVATWTGGVVPVAGDNVNAGAFKITVDVNATCNNYTVEGAVVAGNLVINAGITLTVRGTMNSVSDINLDLLSGSAADSKLKLTGEALAQNGTLGSPKGTVTAEAPIVYLITNFMVRSIRPKNLEIATTGSGIFTIGHTQGNTFYCNSGKTVVKSGSNVNLLSRSNIGKVDGTNEFIIESGATVYSRVIEGSFDGKKINAAKIIINGTLIASAQTTVRNIVIGENGVFKHQVSQSTGYPSWSGWWQNTAPTDPLTLQPGDFATPGSLVLGSNSTIELNGTVAQAIQGIIPENKLYYVGTTPASYFKKISVPLDDSVFVAQNIPYANIALSGGNIKTLGSNLVAKGNVTIVDSTTLLIPVGKVMVVNGNFTVTNPAKLTVEGALINAKSTDVLKGTVSATISATNEVKLVATPKLGYVFVNWTAGDSVLSPNATYTFTPVATYNKVIVAKFDLIKVVEITAAQSGNWSDPATWTGGVVPVAGDNVNVGAFKITVDVNASCSNFKVAGTGVAGNLVINAGITLTVRGSMDCETSGNVDLMTGSALDSKLKLTGEAVAGVNVGTVEIPNIIYYLITDKMVRSIRPKNLEIATDNAKTYTIGFTQGNTFYCNSGKTVVKSGSNVNLLSRTNIGKVDGVNEFIIESGATVQTRVLEGEFTGVKVPAAKMVVNGTLIASNRTTVREFVLGDNGIFKTTQGTTLTPEYLMWDGWWNNTSPTPPTNPIVFGVFATPTSITFGSNSTVEYNATTNQNILGIVPENKVYTGTGTYYTVDPIPAFIIPYVNLKLTGDTVVKTIQSNLIVKKSIEVVSGSMVIPTGKVVVNMGSFKGTLPTVAGALVNVSSNNITMGTVSATISSANEVRLVATPLSGYKLVKWTEGATEVSTSATYAFTPTNGITRTLVANFGLATGFSTSKLNTFVTVEGRNLKLNCEASAVKLYSVQGSLIQSHTNVTNINVLNSGIYIIKMHTAQGIKVQKVLVK